MPPQSLALEANPIERIQGAVAEALARVFGVFDALAIVAVIVAALGIVNTLTMGVRRARSARSASCGRSA